MVVLDIVGCALQALSGQGQTQQQMQSRTQLAHQHQPPPLASAIYATLRIDHAADRVVFKAGGLGAPPVIGEAPAPGADAPWMGGSSDRYGRGVRPPLFYHQWCRRLDSAAAPRTLT